MNPPPFPAAALDAVRDAAKAQMRSSNTAEDALIERHAASALGLCEAFTGTALIARDWTETLGAGSGWQKLGMAPVTAITAVQGLPAEGTGFALASHAYAIDIDGAGQGWVRVTDPGAAGRIAVSYAAGLAEGWDGVPPAIAQGVVLLTVHFTGTTPPDARVPAAVGALWRPWRRIGLGAAKC